MKKKPKERDWMLSDGFELRKVNPYADSWAIFEGGRLVDGFYTVEAAKQKAQELRKSRNEASKANP